MDKKYDQDMFDVQAQELWEQEQTYACKENSDKPLFSIDTPPPTVSGSLHIGHVFSYTQADIIARFKRLSGHNVFYPFGFDNNGLPTEKYVEKKHKVTGFRMGRSDFIDLCMKESEEIQKDFESLWKRLGISADWSRTYSTISPQVRKISQHSFIDLHNKGFVYQKEEPALYCTTCFTSVAQAELDDKNQQSQFNDIVFKAADGTDLVVATTRPELLSSCVAMFYHPEDDRYKHLKDTKAVVPLFGYEVPILADELVEQDKGTGLVMCCTFGDKNDISWFKKYNLPYRQSIGMDGRWKEEIKHLSGMKAHEARKTILGLLKEEDVLKSQRDIVHPVNVHERCGKAIEYVILKQWFLNIMDHKEKFLELAETIEWKPAYMQSRYKDWVENLQWDWCLSRQRFYGIPFPIWHCNDCDKVNVAEAKDLPIDPQESNYPGGKCSQCESTNLRPETDVMDTWNTSSLTPYITMDLFYKGLDNPFESKEVKKYLPMTMRPQAHDIIRTWAFYTLIKTWMHNGTKPWESIVISGHVLSSQKDKISKSKGNNPTEPNNLLAAYPADAIRYWTASGTLGQDIAFTEGQLKVGLKLLTKLWNAFRFTHEHINEAPKEQPKNLGTMNEWLAHRASETFAIYEKQLNNSEFSHALSTAERFFWNDFCDNYLEVIKDQLFKPENYPAEQVAATRWTLHHVGLRLLQLFSPFVPHITETLYQQLFKKTVGTKSIHITDYKDHQTVHSYPESVIISEKLVSIIGAVRRLKTTKQLSLKVELTSLTLHSANKELLKTLAPHEQLLKGITHAETIAYGSGGDVKESTLEQDGETWCALLDLDHVTDESEDA